jgi:hypothetical protein
MEQKEKRELISAPLAFEERAKFPLHKTIMLVVLTVWTNFAENGSLERMITLTEVAFQALVRQV